MEHLWQRLANCQVVDLAHPLHHGMPVSPNHPSFQLALLRRHGDMVRSDGGSAANELIVTGGHVGTHIDAFAHVSQNGLLHGGVEPSSIQSQDGFSDLGVDRIAPILCRGVLLDVATLYSADALEPGYEITVEDLEKAAEDGGVEVRQGDAVLIRTGWSRFWSTPDFFVGMNHGAPGPGEHAARWLAGRGVRLTGAETIAYEVVRPGQGHTKLPAHRVLLVESGIHIIEVMDLAGLAEREVHEFAFVASPLRIQGATGSPLRPLALLDD